MPNKGYVTMSDALPEYTDVYCPHGDHVWSCGYMYCQLYLCASCRDHFAPLFQQTLWNIWKVQIHRESIVRQQHDAEVAVLGEIIDLLEAQQYANDLT